MSVIVQVLEYSRAPVKDGVIRGVKIVGTKSDNGRIYPQDVLNGAIHLYEAAAVYLLHPSGAEKRKNVRRHDDYFGHLLNVRERCDGKIGLGLFGDLHIRQAHPMAQMILESDGRSFGLSHNIVCKMNEEETEVLEILSVNSVDLVDHPATSKNLFEETDMELAELKEALDEQRQLLDKIKDDSAAFNKRMALLEEATPAPEPNKRLVILEDKPPDETSPAIGNTHEDLLAALRGYSIT